MEMEDGAYPFLTFSGIPSVSFSFTSQGVSVCCRAEHLKVQCIQHFIMYCKVFIHCISFKRSDKKLRIEPLMQIITNNKSTSLFSYLDYFVNYLTSNSRLFLQFKMVLVSFFVL